MPATPVTGELLSLPAEAAHHVSQVLRLRVGEGLRLFDGRCGEYAAVIEAVERRAVHVRVGDFIDIDRESPLKLALAQCVSKGERMDYAIQKAVELGVHAILPLLSARSVVRLDDERWEKKLEHWRGVMIAACAQSGRTRLPELAPVQRLDEWLERESMGDAPLKLVLAPAASASLRNLAPTNQAIVLAGPEGGLDTKEIAAAQRRGFTPLAIGPRVLRTETAGVAALAALQALWGDLG